ncbi:MAG: molybdenum cofactor guanylyltransferase [Anaerolineales bacterium]|nr:molybdenum cofactor guanylyltransferase [Anaerolineales bacterium]
MKSVAIQAGGESRRMGQDKALLPFLGTTLVERVISRVAPLGDELLITTNNPQEYLDFKFPLFRDLLPGKGALGGLYTALSVARFPIVIVVACDMPFVNTDILAQAIEKLQANDVDVVIPQTEKGYEPFHAVYRRESCLSAVQSALQSGEKRLISWFPKVKVTPITESELDQYDPQRIAFRNLNTREDFLNAEVLAQELDQ